MSTRPNKAAFDKIKSELDEACAFLRGFTLAHNGFTQRDGRAGIQRVSELCDKLSKFPPSARFASGAGAVVAMCRTRIKAAEARLELLKSRH